MHTHRERHSEMERERYGFWSAVGLAVCRDRNTATALPVNVVVFTFHSRVHSPIPYNGKVIMDGKRSKNIQIYCTPLPNYCVRLLNVPKLKKQAVRSIAALYNVFAMFCESVRPFQMFGELSECRYAVIQWNKIH